MTPKPADVARKVMSGLVAEHPEMDTVIEGAYLVSMARLVLAAEALYEALDEHQVDSPEAHALARALDGEE
jgi:hypothetical protein